MKILFSGCSFSVGYGLEGERDDHDNYCNMLAREYFSGATVKNIGVNGYPNLNIYLDSAAELYGEHYDYAFVGWTSYPRHLFGVGLDSQDDGVRLIMSQGRGRPWNLRSFNGGDLSFSEDFLNDYREKFLLTHNDHFEIVDIIKYVNLLKSQCQQSKTKIYFLNNLCPWDNGYFDYQTDVVPSNLTDYTQGLLNIDRRTDDQIKILYNRIHNDYKLSGGIHPQSWLNLYSSFKSIQCDTGNDDKHPGPISHNNYGKLLVEQLAQLEQ